jgi:hypothetical protein
MSIRRLQGAALIISAVINLVGLIGSGTSAVRILFIIGGLLFIFGVPAIQSVQPMGTLGWVGIVLIELAALVALVFNVMAVSGAADFGDTLPMASAIAAVIGRVTVGWLTTRRSVFPIWAGWAFMADGMVNFIGGLLSNPALVTAFGILSAVLSAAALFAYGWGIMQRVGETPGTPAAGLPTR